MCTLAEYNTGKIYLPSGVRKDLVKKFNITQQTISNSLKRLKNKSLITGNNGVYQLNPLIFWKGENKVRTKFLENNKLSVNINFNK